MILDLYIAITINITTTVLDSRPTAGGNNVTLK